MTDEFASLVLVRTHTVGVRDSDSFLCAFQIPADSTLQLLVPGNVLHRVFSEGSQSLPSRTHTQRAEHNFTLGRPRHLPRIYFFLHHRRETKKAWRFNQLDPVLISGYPFFILQATPTLPNLWW